MLLALPYLKEKEWVFREEREKRYSDRHKTKNMIKAVIVIRLNTKDDILKMGYGAQITLNHTDFHCMDKENKTFFKMSLCSIEVSQSYRFRTKIKLNY